MKRIQQITQFNCCLLCAALQLMGNGVLETLGVIDQEARQFLGKAVEGMVSDIILTLDNETFSLVLKLAFVYLYRNIHPETWCPFLHGRVEIQKHRQIYLHLEKYLRTIECTFSGKLTNARSCTSILVSTPRIQ